MAALLADKAPTVGVTIAGHLEKKGDMLHGWQKRYFELHGDTLFYYNDQGEKAKGEYTLGKASSVGDLSGERNAIQIALGGGKALKVRAPDEATYEAWKSALRSAIHEASQLVSTVCPRTEETFVVPKRYSIKSKLGQGAYGCVAAAIDETTGAKVAVKKVRGAFADTTDAKRILREIRLMRSLAHPGVLGLHDLIMPPSLDHFDDVYMVTPRLDQDLQSIVFSKTPLSEDQTQWMMYQCVAGLNYLHSAGVVHRDLKPANLLIDLESCTVKICDFGLSRVIEDDPEGDGPEETLYVVTRWYRAPEILLGYKHYDSQIDMWSIGTILGELMHRRPLLNGSSFVNQVEKINDLLGTPTEEDIWFVEDAKARNFVMNVLPKRQPADLAHKFPAASAECVDLISRLLAVDPRRRLTAREALDHPYLAPVREADRLEVVATGIVPMDDIESAEVTEANIKCMIFQEIVHFHARE